jgi:hypothetical protein
MERPLSYYAHFTDAQLRATAISDLFRFVLFGGSRGPGKSYWLRWILLRILLILKGMGIANPVVGLFCEDYPTLRDRQVRKIKEEFPKELGVVKTTAAAGLGFYLHGGGMMALRNLDDPSKYQSAEFAAIGVDELTKHLLDVFNILRGSLRWPGVARTQFLAATNPGGIGHLWWVKDMFIDGNFPPEMQSLKDEFAFVKALPADNPYLEQSYWDDLNTLPPALARAWVYGDWDVFEGQVFSEWRRDLHVVKPREIPDNWILWRAVDWGYAAPFCCLWLARHPEIEFSLVYREAYEKELTDPEQVDLIRSLSPEDEKIAYSLADPSMWTRKSTERRTKTSASVYRDGGVPLTKADNDRIGGWRRVHEALTVREGIPRMQIFNTCKSLIRTLPALPYDRIRLEDVDTKAEDHAPDALRYGLSWKVLGHRREPTAPEAEDHWRALRPELLPTAHTALRRSEGQQDFWASVRNN